MAKKGQRFHKSIYFPDWAENSLNEFISEISGGSGLSFSVHALTRVIEYTDEYGKSLLRFLIKSIKKNPLDINEIFEFYSSGEQVKRVCFRCLSEELAVDLILVISRDSTVITVFVTKKGDNHENMNQNLYTKNNSL